MARPNLIDKLKKALPASAQPPLDAIHRRARAESLPLYLVGGAVRDLLLGRPTLDVDLTLEGDAPALALSLPGDRAGSIIDPFGGKADLDAKLLRVLHEASFRDDATRILRGARYGPRLGFRFEPQTLRWLRRDVRYLETISGRRLRAELPRV